MSQKSISGQLWTAFSLFNVKVFQQMEIVLHIF